VVEKSDVLRLHSIIFLYGYQSGSNACGCGYAAVAAAAAAATKISSRSSGYDQNTMLHRWAEIWSTRQKILGLTGEEFNPLGGEKISSEI
jgi:hypothetical protein